MTPQHIRYTALLLLIPFGALAVSAFQNQTVLRTVAHGPIQVDHANLGCSDCHIAPDATWRQQIQANLRYVVGARSEAVDFGYHPVTSDTCLGCHERPNERHPIYRFREARFQDAQEIVDATSCLGCHTEHTNERAFAQVDFCVACHSDLELKTDPLDVSHVQLIKVENWGSCLGCHDFHGNHAYEAPKLLDAAFDVDALEAYFADGSNPYGTEKLYEAKDP